MTEQNQLIHPTAVVAPEAEIGANVQVGAYSVIGPEVKIGEGTIVGPHVVIEGKTSLGKRNHIFQFASIGAAPQDLKFRGEPSEVVIGDENMVREFVSIHRGTEHGMMMTRIGNRNLLMANSHVAHDCVVGNENVIANSCALAGHVEIGNRVRLGGLVGIHQFCRIGDYAILGGGSMVGQDVPPYCLGQGDHCELRGINLIGLKRSNFSDDDIRAIKKAFRLVFGHMGKFEEKVDALPEELRQNERVSVMLDFARGSQRGVCSASLSFRAAVDENKE